MKAKKVEVNYVTAFNEETNRVGKQHIQKPNTDYAYCGYHLGSDWDAEKMNDNNFCKKCFSKIQKL